MTDKQLLDSFTNQRDEAAFESIVRRHGPVVLRICRGILDDPHEVEDAFQATFVVLVKNAESIRDRDSLGPWLYEVAYRVSTRARGRYAKRRVEVGGKAVVAISMAESAPGPDPEHRELVSLLHAEVNRLPQGCREAIVSCYLEGQTHEEAARGLGLPLGTLKGRLRQGRELLRSRLARRGVAVSLGLILLLLKDSRVQADVIVSERLVRSTVDAALVALSKKVATRALMVPVLLAVTTLAFTLTVGPYLSAGRVASLSSGLRVFGGSEPVAVGPNPKITHCSGAPGAMPAILPTAADPSLTISADGSPAKSAPAKGRTSAPANHSKREG